MNPACDFEQRMYFLVMYNLSPIQQAIQAGHAQQEYANQYTDTPEFERWAHLDKTWMVMNGGTSNQTGTNKYNNKIQLGSQELHQLDLDAAEWKHACFYEPDANNALTAIAFLVDERVWDTEKYPDPTEDQLYFTPDERRNRELKDAKLYEYYAGIYNPEVAWMRVWLKKFRFA